MSEKMIPETPERFCADCEYYVGNTDYHSHTCDRPSGRNAITGHHQPLNAAWERTGQHTDNPVTADYEPCGSEGRHWKEKDA